MKLEDISKVLMVHRVTGERREVKGRMIAIETYGACANNFEMNSNSFLEWCEKYPDCAQADKHTEELAKSCKAEFLSDVVRLNNLYNTEWEIVKTKRKAPVMMIPEQELESLSL